MNVVRTVLGDVAAGELGVTYAHEHLIIDSETVRDHSPEISLPSVDEAVAEVAMCAAAGAATMVDAMPIGAGRNPQKLAEVSRRTGVNIVMATGLHLAMYYAEQPSLMSPPDELAAWFIADIEQGADVNDHRSQQVVRGDVKAGVIKIATEATPSSDRDRKVVAAAATAHLETGAPILTHCEGGLGGVEQIEAFVDLGVAPNHLVLSHTDKVLDTAYHLELLAAGVNVEYDQALRQPENVERGTAWLVAEMVQRGHGSQIMLGTDGARRAMWATLGGSPGLAWMLTGLVDQLRAHSVPESAIDAMLVVNPARCFAFAAGNAL